MPDRLDGPLDVPELTPEHAFRIVCRWLAMEAGEMTMKHSTPALANLLRSKGMCSAANVGTLAGMFGRLENILQTQASDHTWGPE